MTETVMDRIMRQIKSSKRISQAEVNKLSGIYLENKKSNPAEAHKAIKKIVEANLALAMKWATKMALSEGDTLEENYQSACVGLTRAAQTFEPEKGFAFSTWATTLIKSEILDRMRKDVQLSASKAAHYIELGLAAGKTVEQMMASYNRSREYVEDILQKTEGVSRRSLKSLNYQVGQDGVELQNIIPGGEEVTIQEIWKPDLLKCINPTEKKFLLQLQKGAYLKDIAREHGLSPKEIKMREARLKNQVKLMMPNPFKVQNILETKEIKRVQFSPVVKAEQIPLVDVPTIEVPKKTPQKKETVAPIPYPTLF